MQSDIHKKQAIRRFLYSPLVLVLFAFLTLFFLYGIIGLIAKNNDTAKNKNLAVKQRAELEAKQVLLEAEIKKLSSNQGIEATIRDKFPVVKEGEGVVMIVDDVNNSDGTNTDSESKKSFWQIIKGWFK
ncbi:MAG: septum formation initiator family protein [Candidatus Paceibacterota bacterium]|jgi:cell division protein FtsB